MTVSHISLVKQRRNAYAVGRYLIVHSERIVRFNENLEIYHGRLIGIRASRLRPTIKHYQNLIWA
ncbi:hypothetical protein LPIBR_10179 [Lacticaseibacillus paracasei]|nr:hypothetical protein LPIBR_10179 [Lacticaseibacillus paracasei]